jgi:hypothetical protein
MEPVPSAPRASHPPAAVAATEHGRRGSGSCRPPQPRHGRAGCAPKWPLANVLECATLPPIRIPIRTPAVAATGGGIERRDAPGCALWQPEPADFAHPEATTPRNRATGAGTRLRVGVGAEAAGQGWAPPPAAHPHPPAGGRGDGRRAAGARSADSGRGMRERVMPSKPAGHPEVSPGAPAPRACRLRVDIPAKWRAPTLLGDGHEDRAPSADRPRADH